MIKSLKSTRTYTLAEIENRLRGDGFNEEEANKVVTALEPKPITIRAAAKKYGLREALIRQWLHRGHLHAVDRVKFPAPGGGKILIDEAQLKERVEQRAGASVTTT